jgi:hypothetical protein
MALEPSEMPLPCIYLVVLHPTMLLSQIDDKFRFNSELFQCPEEFVSLNHLYVWVLLSINYQGECSYLLEKKGRLFLLEILCLFFRLRKI